MILSVSLVPESPFGNEDVTVIVESSDADGDTVTYGYTWYVDGSEVQSGSSSTLTPGFFAKHQRISVEVTPRDRFDDGAPFLSTDAEVLNSLPTATGASITPAAATESSTLTCVPEGYADADGDAEGWTYAWTVNGAEVASTVTLDGSLFNKGDTVSCTATPFDGEEGGLTVTSPAMTIANTPPMLASATLSMTAPTESDTLFVTLRAATDADGDTVSYGYVWVVNGSDVATSSNLTGAHFDKGDAIHVVVTPRDGSEDGAPVMSDTATGANTAPVMAGVTLSPGEVYTNDTLTATATSTDADGDTVTYTYAWYVDGALAAGSASTLSGATAFDREDVVRVVVTPNDGEVSGGSATSASVTVRNSAPTSPVVVLTPEDAAPGDDLTCAVVTESEDADGDAVTYSFAWDVDGVAYAGATNGATSSVVDGGDVGATETWTCIVNADDGTASVSSSEMLTTVSDCLMEVAYTTRAVHSGSELQGWKPTDVNGDGHYDIVVADQAGNRVTVLLGDGTGSFASTSVSTGRNWGGIAIADFDNDGDKDIAVSQPDGAQMQVVRQGPPGSFAAMSPFSQGDTARGLVAMDYDRDGNQDIVAFLADRSCYAVLRGNGALGFNPAACTLSTSAAYAYWPAAFDIDRDGWEELAVSPGTSGVRVYSIATGTPVLAYSLGTNVGYVCGSFDSNVDGSDELVCMSSTGWESWSTDGEASCGGTYPSTTYGVATMPWADFNEDGRVDYIVRSSPASGPLHVVLSTP